MTDPLIDSKLKQKWRLAAIGRSDAIGGGESLQGKLNADVSLNGHWSSDWNRAIREIQCKRSRSNYSTSIQIKDLNEEVNVQKIWLSRFSPQNLSLEKIDTTIGKSDFSMNGAIDNFTGVFIPDTREETNCWKSLCFPMVTTWIWTSSWEFLMLSSYKSGFYQNQRWTRMRNHTWSPENVDFDLNTNIQQLHYNGIDVNNIKGNVNMKEEVASLNGLSIDTMGGTVGLRGSYNSKDHNKPAIDLG